MDRIEKAICKAMVHSLKQRDFELRPDWGGFVRTQPYGHDRLLVINQGTSLGRFFEIKCVPEVRHDRIEIPWNTFGFIWGEDSQKETATLGLLRPRGNLPMMKVTPATQAEDVAVVAQEILTTFEQKALPFYERFADLATVEAFVNRVPLADLSPYGAGGPLEDRAIRSLLLAKAVNPGRYAAVREACVASPLKTLWPREKYLEMIGRVDEMQL